MTIPASELAQIQTDVAAIALDQSCQIQRPNNTPNSRGVPSGTYTTIATVQCGMRQPTGTHLQNFDYIIGSLPTWLVYLPVNTDVRGQDHLIIAGQTLVVQVVLAPQSYAALLGVLASELK